MRRKIFDDIEKERLRQNKLHPEPLPLAMRFVTISEELGEVAEAMQDKHMQSVYRELIDTAACCVRMAEEVLESRNNEIICKATEEATKVLGADPAYFGEEGNREVERQIKKLGSLK